MLSIVRCRQILNEDAHQGAEYSLEEAELLRGILYQIARMHLKVIRTPIDTDNEPSLTLYKGVYGRTG